MVLIGSVASAILIALVAYYFPELLRRPKETQPGKVVASYDFIIVGAGSAGSVLARRLSGVPSWKILLLEAGGDETTESKIPLMHNLQANNALDWNYTTTRQKRSCLATGGICSYRRGHVMGGSSSINAMLHVRGNRADYDDWERLHAATGWNYLQVLPFFIKSENVTIDGLSESFYRGRNGLLKIQFAAYESSLSEAIGEAARETGLTNEDYNGKRQTGIGRSQLNVDGASRSSASTAFLDDLKRTNLHIVKNSKVIKVLIDSKSKTATGIVFKRKGSKTIKRVLVSKEVILSAGAVNTPHILMLSGIGPKDHLKQLKIPLVANLPVGNNLQDHFLIPLPFKLRNYTNLNPYTRMTAENLLELTRNKNGVFTSNGIPNLAFLNTAGGPSASEDLPDVQFHFFESPIQPSDTMAICTTVLKPKSVGTVRLESTNPDVAPLIDPNYFSDGADMDVAVAGLRRSLLFANSKALNRYLPVLDRDSLSLCDSSSNNATSYLTCIAETYSRTVFHPVGTCKMGSPSSPDTVVDPQLRVSGVKRLRVVDASVMPSIIRGNTNAPTMMIAEKASAIIKRFYGIRGTENVYENGTKLP